MNPGSRSFEAHLPLMNDFREAAAVSEREKDPFFLTAFAFQGWVGLLLVGSMAEYGEKKLARERSLQSGQAWRGFQDLFGQAREEEFPEIYSCLLRFAQYADPICELVHAALTPLRMEQGEDTPSASVSTVPARQVLARFCDWLEAVIHYQTHELWHLAPACFDPDPDKRELAALGTNERYLAKLSGPSRLSWQKHLAEAAERFKDSPKWPSLGKAMAGEPARPWLYAEVDRLLIALWPLVKAHQWTYHDLLTTIRPSLPRPEAYPCDTEQALAAYCGNVLGLHKPRPGRSTRNGRPKGHSVAVKLCAEFKQG